MSFIDVLRGGLDVAGGVRTAKRQADTQDAEQSFGLLMHLRQLQDAEASKALQARLAEAQINNYNSEAAHRGEHPDEYDTVSDETGMYSRNKRTGQLTPLTSPSTGKPLKPYHPPQQAPTNVYLPSQQPDGTTTYTVVPGRGPVKSENTGIVKPPASGTSGSQAPVGDMEARFAEIEGHAKDLAAGKWHPTRAMQAKEGMEYGIANKSAGGQGVPLGQAAAIEGMNLFGVATGDDYKRFQSLMNSTRSFGDDAAKVFKGRQNEDAVKREIALSQITPDDYNNPTSVAQKLQRMREIIDLARSTMPAQDKAAPGTAPALPAASSLLEKYNAAVRHLVDQGKSLEEITQMLGPRPQ